MIFNCKVFNGNKSKKLRILVKYGLNIVILKDRFVLRIR